MVLLLIVIYITFISLGLPDSLFGVAWPVAHNDFGLPESFGSIYTIVVAIMGGSVSFFAGPLIKKFGTGNVTAVSVVLTAVSMLGIGFAPNIYVMMAFAILAGLGSGAIDTGLNDFVSRKYKAIHMNWLHCFWGVGVTVSPLIMSNFLKNNDWQAGYRTVSYIQFGISLLVFLSLFLWKKYDKKEESVVEEKVDAPKVKVNPFKIKGVIVGIITLGAYCAVEFILGTWGASYLVNTKDFSPADASLVISLYYGGIMLGRFLSGILSLKLIDKYLIRGGIGVLVAGVILLALPWSICGYIALPLIGIGCAPIFPATLHAIPERYGNEYSTHITGYHMGGAYAIGFSLQVAFGYIATSTTFTIMPYLLIGIVAIMSVCSEIVNKKTLKI